jgi:hypothetical protein
MSTTTPAAPPHQAPLPSLAGPFTRARARDLNFVMLLKNEAQKNRRPTQLRPIVDDLGLAAPRGCAPLYLSRSCASFVFEFCFTLALATLEHA